MSRHLNLYRIPNGIVWTSMCAARFYIFIYYTVRINILELRNTLCSGDASVTAPVVNLQQDPATGQPHLALALTPLSKLQANVVKSSKNKQAVAAEPPKDVALAATFKAPRGGLEVVKGKVILPQDTAATIGPSIFLDVALGQFAIEGNEALKSAIPEYRGKVPIHGNLYSDRAQAEGLGFLSLPKGQIQLLRPLKAEVRL